MNGIELILLSIVSFLLGLLFLGFFLHKKTLATSIENNQIKSKKILEQAQNEADQIIKTALQESKDELKKRRRDFDEDAKKKKTELNKLEQGLNQKQKELSQESLKLKEKELKAEKTEQKLFQREKQLLHIQADYEIAIEQTQKKLEKIANLSIDEAEQKLMESLKVTAKNKVNTATTTNKNI